MSQVVENLKAAKALIADPKNWIQGDYAQGAVYDPTISMGNDPGAVCFCSLGALQKVGDTMHEEELPESKYLLDALDTLNTEFVSVPGYNDNSTHAEVMVLWDRAIQLAEAAN